MSDFARQVVVINGAVDGIGSALSVHFAIKGSCLVLTDVDADRLAELAVTLENEYTAQVVINAGDISSVDCAQRTIDLAVSTYGRIDVLLHNAGNGGIQSLTERNGKAVRAVDDRYRWSALRCALAAIPVMVEAGYGRIVLISNDSAHTGLDDHVIDRGRTSLLTLVGDLSREYGPSGLTFNVLAPLVQSSGFERLKSEQPRLANRVLSGLPMGRPAELAEVVAAVDYLTSREARLVNGLALGADAEWQPL